jgi:hypothetical protein
MEARLTTACLVFLSCAASAAAEGPWKRHVIDDASKGADGVRLADVNGDGLPDIVTGWEQGGAVRLCVNPGPARVACKWPAVSVGNVPDVEDAVCVDLDGDGAADVVSCAEGKARVVSIHWAPQPRESLLDAAAWRTEPLAASAGAMMWMFALPLQVDGLHGIDLIAGGKGPGAGLGWFQAPREPRKLVDWKWHELRPVGWLMSIVSSDMDSDGDTDIVFSGRKGGRSGAFWLENPGPGAAQSKSWTEHAIGGLGQQAMFLQLADLDRDGLEDVLLAVQPKEILWLRRLDRSGIKWQSHSIALPEPTGIAKAVSAGDIDGDGRLDLVFSCEQAKSPAHGLMWLSAVGPPDSGKWTPHALSGSDGVKHDLVALVDLDRDGDLDAITTEEVKNLGVIWYENPAKQP